MSTAALLLAFALLSGARPSRVRARAMMAARTPGTPQRPTRGPDPLAVASTLDVLAVCLATGMAVSSAAAATAPSAPTLLARVLRRAADLLALGADPAIAWAAPPDLPPGSLDEQTDALLRLARRSSASGVALAEAVAALATHCRQDAAHGATASAERAAVLIAGPLGLCFLPAFVCLGIVPVVAGLAGDLLQSGLL
ncbi:type II secretion system F family protein [Candidatus Mycobacterium methanotrophicum]|uniref:Type II secretion system F family protein n=1 Tax=Candidatus Mycobacterium methanotrophicum TaxID=2943498 RepID=A0ABY4QLS2_9MYCO|nr:type II secretion system F family protein [Candidatus Mycobacterium methanotrophicum]UQX11243.1 type II secretion system F family protein [Candidatus Mycobacterium methanotrophicum]